MRRPPATAACSPGASTSRRQHLQQLGNLGLLATGSLSSLHALTAQAQDSQLPLHVLLIGNANYQRNASCATLPVMYSCWRRPSGHDALGAMDV